MGTAFDTFPQYAFGHYDGHLEDRQNADVVSRIAVGGAIGYGVAVANTDYRSARIVTGYDVPTGITLREYVRTNPETGNVEYPQGEEMSVAEEGRVWVTTAGGASVGHPVYAVPDTGAFTNDPNGTATAQAGAGNTGDGTIGSLDAVNGAITGDYIAICTATATDGGTFTVYSPFNEAIGEVDVGVAFDDGVQFTISDGATDFALGDRFTITVTGANRLFPNARFRSAASATERALVEIHG